MVCSGATGHAETVEIVFDPAIISLDEILSMFWQMHNPVGSKFLGMSLGGSQYRSGIYCSNEEQLAIAIASRDALQTKLGKTVSTEIAMLTRFWLAEDYHQKYYEKAGVAACRVN